MLWFFLLVLGLGVVFGWHVAAALLVLWLIGYVAFWLFMLFKPVKGDYQPPVPTRPQQQHEPDSNPTCATSPRDVR
jgi:hypothetical protein